MKHLFVPYGIALQLKEKGFDEPCFAYYDEEVYNKELLSYNEFNLNISGGRNIYHDGYHSITNSEIDEFGCFCEDEKTNEPYKIFTAPLYQQVVDWFDEKHHIFIQSGVYSELGYTQYSYLINRGDTTNLQFKGEFDSRYETLNAAIEEALKLI